MDRKELHAELESLGEEEVRRRLSEGGWVAVNDWAEDWLRFQCWKRIQSTSLRADRRSRLALYNSIFATIIAMIAMIWSARDMIVQFIAVP